MFYPLTMDCKLWARKNSKRLGASSRVRFVKIQPPNGYQVIGGIKLPPDNREVWPDRPWFHHYAVLVGGFAYDELYPKGLPFEKYKLKFTFHNFLEFTILDEL